MVGKQSGSKKYRDIAEQYRQQIVQGELRPNERLATREELASQYTVNMLTIHRALQQLSREGFVVARKRGGTSVVPHPPHLNHHALLVLAGSGLGTMKRSRYWDALEACVAPVESEREGRKIHVFENLEPHVDNESMIRLVQMIRHRQLAGLMFTAGFDQFAGTPVLDDPHLARVKLGIVYPVGRPLTAAEASVAQVHLDPWSYFDQAFAWLRQRGRRRVAVLCRSGCFDSQGIPQQRYAEVLGDRAHRHGLTLDPWMTQMPDTGYQEPMRQLVRLLMQINPRPDALIIGDDHYLQFALAGLADSGLVTDRDLDVVCYANMPFPPPTTMPVRFLGPDVRQLLRSAVETIEKQARRESVESHQMLPAVFGDAAAQQVD